MLSYKCNISIALWSRAENAPLTINRKTNFLVLLRSWVWWMDSTPLFCLLYPRTWTKRVGDLDYKSINFSAKVRYNHVTETAWPRKGARPGPCGPWKLNMQLQVLPDNDTSVIRGPVIRGGREANGVVQIHRLNVSLSQGRRGQIKRDHWDVFLLFHTFFRLYNAGQMFFGGASSKKNHSWRLKREFYGMQFADVTCA